MYAVVLNQMDCLKVLIKHGADQSIKDKVIN